MLKYTTEDFIKKAKKIHGNKYDYSLSIYCGSQKNVDIICPIHGFFNLSPNKHIDNKRGCPKCGNKKVGDSLRMNNNSFIKKAKKIHGDKYDYSLVDYKDTRTKISIICEKHGIFNQLPNSHLISRHGCPYCKSSKGEIKIKQWLDEKNINYIQQYKFNECKNIKPLPFDFYLPDYNMCIEYDGKQHFGSYPNWGGNNTYQKIKKRDSIKTHFCEVNEIILIRINYKDNIENILNEYYRK